MQTLLRLSIPNLRSLISPLLLRVQLISFLASTNWTGIMSLAQPHHHFYSVVKSSHGNNSTMGGMRETTAANYNRNYDACPYNSSFYTTNLGSSCDLSRNLFSDGPNYDSVWSEVVPSSKRRKVSDFSCESNGRPYQQFTYENGLQNHVNLWKHVPPQFFSAYASTTTKLGRSKLEDEEEVVLLSRDKIDMCSPSRKDGIDVLHETRLRYSYCAFIQNLGVRLDIPKTTVGTAIVLCHRFFVRRSHASHDRFLIATAMLFLTSKSEETSRPLNDVLKVASEILHGQEFSVLSYMLPIDWFKQYRERIIEAEQLILTTLNFELSVQHPYEYLTSTLQKIGFFQSGLVNLASSLISDGLKTSLWLQFKPHQIAAGAAYLAAKFINLNLDSCHNFWQDFHTPPSVLRDVAHQLMELF